MERQRLDRMIVSLEALNASVAGRRGRKNMSAAERQRVSERMKVYWESRRSSPERLSA